MDTVVEILGLNEAKQRLEPGFFPLHGHALAVGPFHIQEQSLLHATLPSQLKSPPTTPKKIVSYRHSQLGAGMGQAEIQT